MNDMKPFTYPDPPSEQAFPIARPGYPYIFAAAFITAVFALLKLTAPALLFLLVTLFICWFFRDPDRLVPGEDNAVVSPADGKIIKAEMVTDSPYFEGTGLKISIFMNIFNVHVNRFPYTGTVKKICYHPGKFLSANLDKASAENEHNAVYIEMENNRPLCVVQIAGLVARRIICQVKENDRLEKGQRFGLICFGSRLDVYLPEDAQPAVRIGDKVQAGSTIIARL